MSTERVICEEVGRTADTITFRLTVADQAPPAEATCETCRHSEYSDIDDGDALFYCRRRPPVPVYGARAEDQAWWPRVHSFDYCGEHEGGKTRGFMPEHLKGMEDEGL